MERLKKQELWAGFGKAKVSIELLGYILFWNYFQKDCVFHWEYACFQIHQECRNNKLCRRFLLVSCSCAYWFWFLLGCHHDSRKRPNSRYLDRPRLCHLTLWDAAKMQRSVHRRSPNQQVWRRNHFWTKNCGAGRAASIKICGWEAEAMQIQLGNVQSSGACHNCAVIAWLFVAVCCAAELARAHQKTRHLFFAAL